MIYKSYKFTNRECAVIKVRFYFTGIYTIVDKNGEHEMGLWSKEPLLRADGRPSKDKSCVLYKAKSFSHKVSFSDTWLKTVARQIASYALACGYAVI